MHHLLVVLFAGLAATAAGGDALPRPILYLPLDGSTAAALASGSPRPRTAMPRDVLFALVQRQDAKFAPGRVGLGYDVGSSPLEFECAGNFRPDEGTCSFWLSPHFRGDDKNIYCTFFGAADWGMLYKYAKHTSLTLGTAKPDRDLYYDCTVPDISAWRPGQWHHVVATWSRSQNARRVYVDGKLQATAPFPWHRPVTRGPLFIGAGCTLYPGHVAHARLDEVAIWDRPLDDQAVRHLYTLGTQSKPLWPAAPSAQRPSDKRIAIVKPIGPTPPAEQEPAPQRTRTRETLPLDGWWHVLPSTHRLADLPREGWGLTRVPGYWTSRDGTLGPDGKPAKGKWGGRPLSDFALATCQRAFVARQEWRGKAVFLQLDGVDGLAEVFLNGQRIGRLPGWEPEAYDIGSALRYGKENALAVVLFLRGGSKIAGIYGSVSLRILPQSFVNDVVVRPRVTKGQVNLSCDVWHAGETTEARIEFEVAPALGQDNAVKRFDHRRKLAKAARAERELSAQAQRVECTFDWKDAHPWTYDDPFLYRVRARLHVGGKLVDETPWCRFGYREFTMRGSDFLLNGVPTHLRGHQIDFGWGDQMARLEELKPAGMNCFELSGPIRCNWYSGTPYRAKLFEQVLDYADEHGLIALPILPDAKELKERIFEPEVARLYRRRVEKHVRRYGNHPSIGMWYMHFNLAGYRWYHPPQKIDGSYKPSDTRWRTRERYALEAQRIAQTIDPRPVYHHACGALGDIYTLNCYIGPTAPLQEREEWPRRWAAKHPFPLLACEHGLMLIPYWFRPRQFPLSVVYNDEPLFDELAAKYLGRRAYRMVTPQLFDLYDVGRKPRGSRLHNLIQRHPGYQEVKGLFARHSLRAWRTWGVSGIIWNAINWDFKDAAGRPLPVMRALARYFADTDMYIAGPKGDWPSKDHSFFAGERIRKQIVLLNDLTRDIPCTLEWRLEDTAGKLFASGKLDAVARAGTPTMCPIELRAPQVKVRTGFHLVVSPGSRQRRHFWPEAFDLQVFPTPSRVRTHGNVLVLDPAGETARMLAKAGVEAAPLDQKADLRAAALVVVGKRAYGATFLAAAKAVGLERAVAEGLNLLVLEQAGGTVCGLELREQSARRVFIASPGHPLLEGLAAEDFVDLRGRSDLIEPYPEAPAETERKWPKRYFKWGNRGVVATFVATKPHYAPFVPVLECGFDLVDSPLLEARIGKGRVVLCQVDVTSRYGTDPVSTRLLSNLLTTLSRRGREPLRQAIYVAEEGQAKELERAAREGATVVLRPGSPLAAEFGLDTKSTRLFIGRVGDHPLLTGLSDGDLYLKQWTTIKAACPGNGWKVIAEPGVVAVKQLGRGRLVACQLDPATLGNTRARVKALRFWNVLLSNAGAERRRFASFLEPTAKCHEPNAWEQIPPFINW